MDEDGWELVGGDRVSRDDVEIGRERRGMGRMCILFLHVLALFYVFSRSLYCLFLVHLLRLIYLLPLAFANYPLFLYILIIQNFV